LRQAQARADRAERELDRTKRSAAYVVGDLFVRAAKDPRRLLMLPRDLWRTWRLRRSRRAAPKPAGHARTREVLDLDAARLLVPRIAAVAPGRGLSIAGAIASATARGWVPYAAVSPALPHEAAALVEAIDPDVVVIDTSAALPGQAWSHLGDPAAVDRLLAAGALDDAAHALGRPAVLLRMTSPAHTAYLDALARRCDLVVDGPGAARRSPWHPGVDPLAEAVLPEAAALLITSTPSAPTDEIARDAARSLRIDPALPPDVGWSRALAASTGLLAEPVTAGLLGAGLDSVSALAAGRRVLAPGDTDLARMLSPWEAARTAVATSSRPEELAEIARRGPVPLTADEHRATFAAILLAAAAPVQLTVLAERGHPLASAGPSTGEHLGPHLPVRAYGSHGVCGPLVVPGLTPCLRCHDLHRRDGDPGWPLIGVQWAQCAERHTPIDSLVAHQLAGMTVALLRRWIDAPEAVEHWSCVAYRLELPLDVIETEQRPAHPLCGCQWDALARTS
jgi:hypothetical protein